MSKGVPYGHSVRRKRGPLYAIQWTGNGRVPEIKLFLAGLDVRILVDAVSLELFLKWPNYYAHLPMEGWLLRDPEQTGPAAISYYKADEFFDAYEYTNPPEWKK